ncbi:MAG: hypothetical protein ACFFBP_16965 [Promethearchaeota archaeon]
MNFWIIDSKKGITLVFYSSMGIFLDENIVSGLISALNQLTMIEFKQPIQSINMGGFKWIYMVEQEINLLFVMSDSIEVSTDIIKGRLSYLKQLFYKQYIQNKEKWKEKWTGDLEIFKSFKNIIEDYYNQWTNADHVDSLAEFYDAIGIFQELLNMTKNLVENHCFGEQKNEIYELFSDVVNKLINDPEIEREKELHTISFSIDYGFNIFDIDPMNCNLIFVKKKLKELLLDVFSVLKKELGYEPLLLCLNKEKIFQFIYENLNLIKTLNLDHFILKIILVE